MLSAKECSARAEKSDLAANSCLIEGERKVLEKLAVEWRRLGLMALRKEACRQPLNEIFDYNNWPFHKLGK